MSDINKKLRLLLYKTVEKHKKYERVLSEIPKGSLVGKNIGGRQYYYLAYRDGKKVKYRYVGKLCEDDIKRHRDNSAIRRKVKRKLNDTGRKIVLLKEVLKIHAV